MPWLGFPEERLDPDRALPHRLLIARPLVVSSHALEVFGLERAVKRPAVLARSTGGLDRAGVAGRGRRPVDGHALRVFGLGAGQGVPFGTAVLVALTIVGEPGGPVERRAIPV